MSMRIKESFVDFSQELLLIIPNKREKVKEKILKKASEESKNFWSSILN